MRRNNSERQNRTEWPILIKWAHKILSDAGLAYPNLVDGFDTIEQYFDHLRTLPASTLIATGRAVQIISESEAIG